MNTMDEFFINAKTFLMDLLAQLLPPALVPWMSLLVTISAIAAVAPLIMLYMTWLERKLVARMQNRFGPNRVGLYGLAQPLSDGLKMLIKEDIVPQGSDRLLHTIAPILSVVPAIMLFAVIPFGRNMLPADLNVGLLYVFAVSSISSYAIFMGGWSSHSKFSILGAMRAVAQIISYEVPSAMSVVAVIMVAGSLSMAGIIEAQDGRWFAFTPWGAVGLLLFFLSGVAEVNRTPFDMPEAESEIVAGFHTEYSGMKFGLWYMAEFLESFAICAFAVTFFLGGWKGPYVPFWIIALLGALTVATAKQLPAIAKLFSTLAFIVLGLCCGTQPVSSWMWFFIKTYLLFFVLVWLRGTFPRLRVDQLMGLAWKFLLPLSLVNIVCAGIWIWLPFPLGTILSALLLVISAILLVRLNRCAPLSPRTYVLTD